MQPDSYKSKPQHIYDLLVQLNSKEIREMLRKFPTSPLASIIVFCADIIQHRAIKETEINE